MLDPGARGDRNEERSIESNDAAGRRGSDPGDAILRAKYLDWCSARLAERFLKLTPEEIYELAERSSRGPLVRADGSADATAAAVPSFRTIVERVTEALTIELDLPGFDEWAQAYTEDPARFDGELLGLWREQL